MNLNYTSVIHPAFSHAERDHRTRRGALTALCTVLDPNCRA
ncbi:MAG TPA: hypothetical protein VLZ05_00070 [Mycobacterium sp.]|nr:hypothetical protein [Mycobacterium sp.]HUH67417.1 hypothetical protein [Mycobacterium sp.]